MCTTLNLAVRFARIVGRNYLWFRIRLNNQISQCSFGLVLLLLALCPNINTHCQKHMFFDSFMASTNRMNISSNAFIC